MTSVTLEQAAQRFEITDCIHRYCHAIDRRRWSLMESVFHPDATYKFFSIDGGWRDFVVAAEALINPMGTTNHQVSNIMIRFESDTVAFSETYLTAFHHVPVDYPAGTFLSLDGGGVLLVGGRYVDRFEQRDGVWKIAHRHGLFDWRQDHALNDGSAGSIEPGWRGGFGDADASRIVVSNWL